MVEQMRDLISASFGSEAAAQYGLSRSDKEQEHIVASANAIMAHFAPDPFICTFLAPWWSRHALEYWGIPSLVVAGNFYLSGAKIFGTDEGESICELIASFDNKNKGNSVDWCGHIWCDFDGLIGDASLALTGMHIGSKKLLNAVGNNLYPNRPFILKREEEMFDLSYEPVYLLKPTEIDSLVEGGKRHITNGRT